MRRSIEVEGFHHSGNPIPAASRVGSLVATGGVYGLDPETGTVAATAEEQVRLTFWQLRRILDKAGASFDDVAKMTFYVASVDLKPLINKYWLMEFRDEQSRPARHTLMYDSLPGDIVIQCDALAFVSNHD
ncbi:MAG: hypothetical protein RL519_757 [Pseudomonadota bacterium]|uniref:RidA family protein n=1 Tax=Novosphingobium subterraneum TaxID=48936 RepID=UPI00350475C3